MKKMNVVAVILSCMFILMTGNLNAQWLLDGNTNGAVKYIGTDDNYDFPIYTNNTQRCIVTNGGNVGIGTNDGTNNPTSPQNKLLIENGDILQSPNDVYSVIGAQSVSSNEVGLISVSNVPGSTTNNVAILGFVRKASSNFSVGVVGVSQGDASVNNGTEGNVSGNDGADNIGVGAYADGSDAVNRGVNTEVFGDGSLNRGIEIFVSGDNGVGGGTATDIPDNAGIFGEVVGVNDINFGSAFTVSGADEYNFASIGVAHGTGIDNGTQRNVGAIGAIIEPNAGDNDGSDNIGVGGYIKGGEAGDQINYAVYGKHGDNPTSNDGFNYAGYFDGDVYTSSSAYYSSDPKLKKDIKEYKNALEQLGKLNIKSYTFNHEKFPYLSLPQGPQVGVLSTDMKKIFPHLVKGAAHPASPFDKDDQRIEYEAVNYNAFIPMLVGGVQELNGANNDLQNKVAELADENADMRKQIDELKNLLNDICNNGCEGLRGTNSTPPSQDVILYPAVPNPTSSSATLSYAINTPFGSALLSVVNIKGNVIKEYKITGQGTGSVVFEKNNLPDGTYKYSLTVDGKPYDTKSIVITRN